MSLKEYKKKRNFEVTPEPGPEPGKTKSGAVLSFVIQKHQASHLHYDFRLEFEGVLKSWAVPKGPCLDPKIKRMAIEVEDHPVAYGDFEGTIPKGEYGAGSVIVWDKGTWAPIGQVKNGLSSGRLEFELYGEKLRGRWILVRTRGSGTHNQWFLIKRTDSAAQDLETYDVVTERSESILSGKELPKDAKSRKGSEKNKTKVASEIRPEKKIKKSYLKFTEPQLAELASQPPAREGWAHEVKFDGYRTLVAIENGKPKFFTRNGLDWSAKYKHLQKPLIALKVDTACLDGEICVPDENGHTSFSLLQQALKNPRTTKLSYYLFDILELDGEDLRKRPLLERKQMLKALLEKAPSQNLVYSDHWIGKGSDLLEVSRKLGLEGIISKKLDSPYQSGRSNSWIKTKCNHDQEFVIGGYSLSEKGAGFKSLLLGHYEGKGEERTLIYVGRVGTGFGRSKMSDLLKKFKPLLQDSSPFAEKIELGNQWRKADHVQWLSPKLTAKVEFRGWTRDRQLRQAAFKGLREDKPAHEVEAEPSVVESTNRTNKKSTGKKNKKKGNAQPSSLHLPVKITHPSKILIPGVQVTKADLILYYRKVNEWMLAQVAKRPLSMLRCPDGIKAECFFQKHLYTYHPPQLETEDSVSPQGKQDHLIYLETLEGLEALVQIGVLEIHTRGTHRDYPNHPDLIVFDLDPGPGTAWKDVVAGTYLIRDTLVDLGLESFVKTSGGKGFHIHVPIRPIYSWDQIKEFSKTVATHLSQEHPKKFVASISKAKRPGKIFIDYLRNGYGATAIAPYSVRARAGAPIAMPITWKEVATLKADAFTLKDVLSKSSILKRDPWGGYGDLDQEIKILASATLKSK